MASTRNYTETGVIGISRPGNTTLLFNKSSHHLPQPHVDEPYYMVNLIGEEIYLTAMGKEEYQALAKFPSGKVVDNLDDCLPREAFERIVKLASSTIDSEPTAFNWHFTDRPGSPSKEEPKEKLGRSPEFSPSVQEKYDSLKEELDNYNAIKGSKHETSETEESREKITEEITRLEAFDSGASKDPFEHEAGEQVQYGVMIVVSGGESSVEMTKKPLPGKPGKSEQFDLGNIDRFSVMPPEAQKAMAEVLKRLFDGTLVNGAKVAEKMAKGESARGSLTRKEMEQVFKNMQDMKKEGTISGNDIFKKLLEKLRGEKKKEQEKPKETQSETMARLLAEEEQKQTSNWDKFKRKVKSLSDYFIASDFDK